MTTVKQLDGKKPHEVLPAEVKAKVLVSTGHKNLAGTEITFPFFAIEWSSVGCEEGGVLISLQGHSYCVVEEATMVFTGNK